ncbi:MAG TPA: hypothetical protein VM266_01435 [Solirubrobacteraceae bacterium]|nr:hypothetical protein [Solirubrobacteraceae bacterium]
MKAEELALVRGIADTKLTLRAWQRRPMHVLRPWALGSLVVAIGLLVATGIIALYTRPDESWMSVAGITRPATFDDYLMVLFRNSLVLALHALACVAGFIAGSSLPVAARDKRGLWRKVHDRAGPLAIGFVVCATVFSLATQAFALGAGASTLASQLQMTPPALLLVLSLHAVPELVALFLPLAAWTVASRQGRWHELLAATFVTVAIAVPILLAAAAVEIWVTPEILFDIRK